MTHRFGGFLGFVAVVATAVGCRNVAEPVARSPLKPPCMSADAVVLEVFFVRFPMGQPEGNGLLWPEIDQMHVPAEVRQALDRNGFCMGTVGGQVPAALAKLLELKDKPPPGPGTPETGVTDLEQEPRVVRRHIQTRAAARNEIVASDTHEELPVLLCDGSGVRGETFNGAQAVLAAKAFPQRDGRVRLKLVPEMHYGESKLRYVTSLGALRIEPGRSRRVFDELAIEAVLAPGGMIVLGTPTDRPGTLGHCFLTHNANGQTEQKLLVVRLAQTQHDELFDAADVLPVDALSEEK